MKTQNNKPTCSASNAHKGQTATDTNNASMKFKATLVLGQQSSGHFLIEAATLEEAREKARDLHVYDVDDWEVYKEFMYVDFVEQIKEGQDNV
jgi:hypothetical protein